MITLDAMGTLLELEPPAPLLRAELEARGVEVSVHQAFYAMRSEIYFYRDHHDVAADAASLAALRNACADVLRRALEYNHVELGRLTRDDVREALLAALRFRAYPETRQALVAAREAGQTLVVVSNWDVSLHEVLERVGLRDLVDGVVTSAEARSTKPDGAIFAEALRLGGRMAHEACHVGNSLTEDVTGARAAGMRAVLVAREPLTGAVPEDVPVIPSLDGLQTAYPYSPGQ